ncbi:HU family DNA-binding protein [Methylobacterium sp. E-045]|uniref:HU family DNA-binding protein n=1 Tax=Methylobacterium sp. E-045 TaxID=2836575 RepID=UPI001FBAE761|nr:HU family DNA-binding protein [Methylobacterium sp. E-045]MCJ2131328.1 integration host factor subunit beta [Methylobacterium sp. E-045]
MVKSELAARIAEQNPHLYAKDAEAVVNAIVARMREALVKGDRVELRGFGSFSIKSRDAREARNPKTGGIVSVKSKNGVVFHPGKGMRDRLNSKGAIV